MCAYVTDDKYIIENERIKESGKELYVRGINEFIEKCSKYPLFNALNPTMMIVCNQLMMIFQSRGAGDYKAFFQEFLPEIKSIFEGRNVKDEKLLQDIIVYFSHLYAINNQHNPEREDDDIEFSSDEQYTDDDDGVYADDLEEDTGGDYF